MLDIKVRRWRASFSSYIILLILAGALSTTVYLVDSLMIDLLAGMFAGALVIFCVIRSLLAYNRTKMINKILDQGTKTEGWVVGYTTKRSFDSDLSPFSLLAGSSGIQFPQTTIFEVKTPDGVMFRSDRTNVPSKIATDYVSQNSRVDVYDYKGNFYVYVEGLSDFNLSQMI